MSVEWTGVKGPWVYILTTYEINRGNTLSRYLVSANDGGPVDLIGVGSSPGGSVPSLEVWIEFKKKNGQFVASTHIFCPYTPA